MYSSLLLKPHTHLYTYTMYSTLLPNHVHTHPHTYTKFSTLLIDQKHQEGPEVGLQDSGKYSTIRREHILCLQDSGKYSALSLNHIHTYLYTYTMHSTPGSGGSEPARQRLPYPPAGAPTVV